MYGSLSLEQASALANHSTLGWGCLAKGKNFKPYTWMKVLERDYLHRMDIGELTRLTVSAPSQHGKSTLAAELYASRYLARHPRRHVAVVSYGDDRATVIGSNCKTMLEEHGELFGVSVSKKKNSKVHWEIANHGGSMRSVGWEAGLTGFPVDLLIVDDIIKNMAEAQSTTYQAKWMEFWQTVATQRLTKDGQVIIIATRWCPEDLIGQVLRVKTQYGKPFEAAVFKAISTEDEYYRDRVGDDGVAIPGALWRKAGEPLCPDLHPLEQLLEAKETVPFHIWETMYQGNPTTPEGNLWDQNLFADTPDYPMWVEDMPDDLLYLTVAVDSALGKDLKRSDYSAIVAMGMRRSREDKRIYVSASLERQGPDQTLERLLNFIEKLPMEPDTIGFDSNQFQVLAASNAEKRLREAGIRSAVYQFDVEMKQRKEDRIMELDQNVRDRDFIFVRSKGTELLVSQMKQFPHGAHDDGPDALWMAADLMLQQV